MRLRVVTCNIPKCVGGVDAVLSRFPITETRNIALTIPLTKRRGALHVRCRMRRAGHGRRARTPHLYNLHLGLSKELRRLQLLRLLSSRPFVHLHPRTPLVLAGDFNDVWGTLGGKHLTPVGFTGLRKPLRTFPAWAPVRALDSVYVRGDIDLVHVERVTPGVARWALDHLPLIAEVALL